MSRPMSRPLEMAVLCTGKPGLRAVYAPVLRALADVARVRLFLLDFPQDYDIRPLLESFRREGVLAECTLLPDNTRWRAHHRAMRPMIAALRQGPLDALISDGDFLPVHQHAIRAARAQGALVLVLEVSPPARLVASHGAGAPSRRPRAGWARLLQGPERRQRLRRATRELMARLRYHGKQLVNYWALPLLTTGRPLSLGRYEWEATTIFASARVDAALVYDRATQEALTRRHPRLRTVRVRHPLSARCRCNGRGAAAPRHFLGSKDGAASVSHAPSSSRLLVTLKGPWRNYVRAAGSSEGVLERWCETIAQAVALRGFQTVDIRPHPREDGREPLELAERLRRRGLEASLTDARAAALADVICDYAGVIGPPSGALAEAAQSCRRAFVVGVEGVQEGAFVPRAQAYAPEVRTLSAGQRLQPEHFTRPETAPADAPSVHEAVLRLLAERRQG